MASVYDESTMAMIKQVQQGMAVNHGFNTADAENEAFAQKMVKRNAEIAARRMQAGMPVRNEAVQPIQKPIPTPQRQKRRRMASARIDQDDNLSQNVPDASALTPDAVFGTTDKAALDLSNVASSDVSDEMRRLYNMGNESKAELEPAIEPEVKIETTKSEPVYERTVPSDKHANQNIRIVAHQPIAASSYESFNEITGLPTEGRFYAEKMRGQALKLEDSITLGDIDSDNVVEQLSEIIGRRIRGEEPLEILSADELYIMEWLRASSFPDVPIPHDGFECDCGFVMSDPSYTFNFRNMEFIMKSDLDEIYEKHKDGCYRFTLPDGRGCDVFLRRRLHDTIVLNEISRYEKANHKDAPPKYIRMVGVAAVIEIDGCDNWEGKLEYLKKLPGAIAKVLYDEVDRASIAVEVRVKHTCPKCGGTVYTPYSFQLDTYFPDL